MAAIHITDIESAINWWRERSPSPDGITACAEVRALATVYALMVYYHEPECIESTMPAAARDAWLAWYASTPDAPCIAICSTSQGDDVCKGCGRSVDEVRHWPRMTPAEKRATWRRITMDGTAWRFNRYAERAREGNPRPATDVSAAPAAAVDAVPATPTVFTVPGASAVRTVQDVSADSAPVSTAAAPAASAATVEPAAPAAAVDAGAPR